jgi:ribulose 1,5-bisphosphate synthetase/thiazole synthase
MRHVVALVFLFATAAFADPIVIRAAPVIDGRGHVLRKAEIVAVEAHPKKVDIDPDSPGTGGAWFYLVTARNALGEGSMGTNSAGVQRVNANPCP